MSESGVDWAQHVSKVSKVVRKWLHRLKNGFVHWKGQESSLRTGLFRQVSGCTDLNVAEGFVFEPVRRSETSFSKTETYSCRIHLSRRSLSHSIVFFIRNDLSHTMVVI